MVAVDDVVFVGEKVVYRDERCVRRMVCVCIQVLVYKCRYVCVYIHI